MTPISERELMTALEAAGRRRRMNGTVERVTPKENEDACS